MRTLLTLVVSLLAAQLVWADPRTEVLGNFDTRSETGARGTLTVLTMADGNYRVVRRVTCHETGPYELHGVGKLRRGLLLVEFEKSPRRIVVPEPGDGEAEDSAADDLAGDGGSGGMAGGIDPEDGHFPAEEAPIAGAVVLGGSVGKGGENRPVDVERIQVALGERGYLQGEFEPGVVDAALIEAIRRFQIAEVGYRTPDSRVDTDNRTIRALNGAGLEPRAFIVYGSVGHQGINNAEDVRVIQGALVQAGYLIDGTFEPGVNDATLEDAIRRYQVERAGFNVPDGRVDINNRTLRQLNSEPFAEVLPQEPEVVLDPEFEEPFPETGLPLPDVSTDPILGDGDPEVVIDPAPPVSEIPPALLAALPELDPQVSVAAYLISGDALMAVVHDRSCAQTAGRWILDKGARQGQKVVAEAEEPEATPENTADDEAVG